MEAKKKPKTGAERARACRARKRAAREQEEKRLHAIRSYILQTATRRPPATTKFIESGNELSNLEGQPRTEFIAATAPTPSLTSATAKPSTLHMPTVKTTVEQCKRKWKNLRDAYRAEVRRMERRKEHLKASGTYNNSTDVRSKWAYFEPMSFINDSRRSRQHTQHKSEGEGSNDSHDNDEAPGFHSMCDIKLEPYHLSNEDEFEDDDRLLEEFVNAATPQAVRRLSNSISEANAVEDAAMADLAKPSSTTTTKDTAAPTSAATATAAPTGSSNNCKCSNRAADQVHFLETLEREEQSLMQSTRMDMRRDTNTSHVGDSDYNFLVSFLPQMKRMSDLQNLQFRAKMSELLLNIMTPQTSVVPVQPMAAATISGTQYQEQQQQKPVLSLLRSSVPAIQQQIPQKLMLTHRPEQLNTSDLMEGSNDLGEDSSNNWT